MSTENKQTLVIVAPEFRLSYPNIFTRRKKKATDPADKVMPFDCQAIWDPEYIKADPDRKRKWDAFEAAINAVRNSAFPNVEGGIKMPLKDDAKRKALDLPNPKEIQGKITATLVCYGDTPPGAAKLVNGKPTPFKESERKELYAGCYCVATLQPYSFNNQSKGVSLGLRNIVKVRDGEPLANRASVDEDFKEFDFSEWETDNAALLNNDDLLGGII